MNRRQFIGAASAAIFFASASNALATSPEGAKALIERVTADVIALVRAPGAPASKQSQFRAIINDNADLRQIAGFAAGRYARAMTPEQRDRYVDAFVDMVTSAYVQQFSEYEGEQIIVNSARSAGTRGYLVNSEVRRSIGSPILVDWLVQDNRDGRTVITDIVIEGVSLASQQRTEITGMIAAQNGDIEAFISALRSRIRT